jgi:3-hydroxyisobutyrate dehydrogenase-like beta-hydroxyacid dehydrogenase
MGERVGLVSPGAMGAHVGAALVGNGHEVLWAGRGRSEETRRRATEAGLVDAGDLRSLTEDATLVLSVCPPGAAGTVAALVAEQAFSGLYVDANAVSPSTARSVEATVTAAGATYVDGGIVGPPPRSLGTTRLYLAGAKARAVALLFDGTPLAAVALDAEPPAASALKMCYAAYTKGAAALLLAIRALAASQGVDEDLLAEWAQSLPELEERSEFVARRNAPKAWRFVDEMHEIADTFRDSALPDGFHRAAADIYSRLVPCKGGGLGLDEVLQLLLRDER